jgi:Domain of unknown function (DUF4145)
MRWLLASVLMSTDYVAPVAESDGFNCPYCGAFAHQVWGTVKANFAGSFGELYPLTKGSKCGRCHKVALWQEEVLIHPPKLTAPPPHPDLPEKPLATYEEARNVVAVSARAGAALIRVTLQELLPELGANNVNLNAAVGELVELGLPPQIQQAMDAVRVIGNNAVHPGQIDFNDTPGVALALFDLVNLVVETMIAQPRRVQEVYDRLPNGAHDQIRRRDA